MSIVKMKRLRLLAMRSDREELLCALQKLGCVEIREPPIDLTDPNWAALGKPEGRELAGAKEKSELLGRALKVLDKYAPAKGGLLKPRPELSERAFFDNDTYRSALEDAEAILEAERTLAGHVAEQGKLQNQKASLTPWLSLDVPLEFTGGQAFSVIFGTVPVRADFAAVEAAVAGVTDLAQMFSAGTDRELQYFLLVCYKGVESDCLEALRLFGYAQANLRGWTGTAAGNVALLNNRLMALGEAMEEDRARVASFAERRQTIQTALDRTAQEVSRWEAEGRLIDTEDAFYLDGWLPAEDERRLAESLDRYTCAWETDDPAEEEYPAVPVKLKNGLFSRCMNAVTEMYSLPAYDGVDPNPFMAPFFILFFGAMMADMGYGLLMIAGSAVYLRRVRPKNPAFMEMIFWCGISSLIVGALTGSFFGDLIPKLITMLNPDSTFALPALLSPLEDITTIMIGSLILGFVQILTGMAISAVKKIRDGNRLDALFDEVAWWVVLAGMAMWICGMMLPGPAALGGVGKGALIAGVLMLALGGTRKAKGFGKVTGFVGIVYNGVTGFFSDTLSYIRLMALMVSGSVIASVFSTLGATTGNVVLFFAVTILGNTLNLALNLLGCYIHDLRLQCLEFFGRFYKEGGKPFAPLEVDTKYIKVIKEEK